MAETKQETLQSNTQAEEPAQSPVERVTEKVKDPKKVAAGRAGAAAWKAKQERLLKQLQGAKESFRPPAGDGTPANIPPKEADQEQAVSADKRPEHREGLTNWTPWIVGARQARTTAQTASGSQGIISSPCRRRHACQYTSKGSGPGTSRFRG